MKPTRVLAFTTTATLLGLVLAGCGGSTSRGGDGGNQADGGDSDAMVATCEPNPCGQAGRMTCAIVAGQAQCMCDPGTHDEAGDCVPDVTCGPTTCNGHGTCTMTGTALSCSCEPGFAGANCAGCDTAAGYHADGAGGCTMDACLPSPCSAANTHCTATGGIATCVCNSGFHDQMGSCVADQVCTATTCSGHGTCSVSGGLTSCACSAGYTGTSCNGCDTGAGYHADGAGGCTTSTCLPNPCTASNKTMCTQTPATTSGYTCSCDTGYHDDGVGNCTTDVCRPNPCATSNQACRPATTPAGYECYVPACNDMNPCTTDTLVGGNCQHANLPDTSTCSTTLCLTGQRCTGGTCGGGTAVTCNDGNPCTRNECDASAGCRYPTDDTLIPDDSISCTVDSCSGGVRRNLATDVRCDDNLYCTGTERCAPTAPGAAALTGCVTENVPAPPAEPWSPCRSYGACTESVPHFALTQQPLGASCNDRIACTSDDRCTASGACVGTAAATCAGGGSCMTTSPWQSGIDFSLAVLEGDVTMNGGAIPATSQSSTSLDLYLVDRTTRAYQYIGGPRWSSSPFPYPLQAGSAHYTATVLPGVYDILYRRGFNTTTSSGTTYVYATSANDTVAYGEQLLAQNVVIGPGHNLRDIDVSLTTLSGTIRMNAGPVPATSRSSTSLDFYLVDTSTGAHQYIGGPRWSSSPFPYPLQAGTDSYVAKILPGTYDLLYRRGFNTTTSSGTTYVYATDDNDTVPYGEQLLRRAIVIAPGAQTLDIDFGMADITGTVTFDTGAVPATSQSSTSLDFYLVDRTTRAYQYIGGPRWSSSPFPYPLQAGTTAITAKVLPGTYDLLYRRGFNTTTSSGTTYVYATSANDTVAYGEHLLREGIVIGSGAQDLPIDFSMATISGDITMNMGSVPATSRSSTSLDFYLRDRGTGAYQYIGGPRWSSSPFPYPLQAGTAAYVAKVVPGSYDLLYRRGFNTTTSSGTTYVYATDDADTVAYGEHLLRENITIAPGAQALPIDFSMASLSGAITMNGGAVPATSQSSTSLDFYLRDQSTGAYQYIGGPRWSSSPFPYPLQAGTAAYDAKVVPGTYDLLYRRGFNTTTSSGTTYVYATDDRDTVAYGEHLLRTGIVIAPGAQALPIDFSMAQIGGPITQNLFPVPRTSRSSTSLDFYVIDRSTGALQYIGGPRWSSSPFPYPLQSTTDQYDAKLVPGTYDLLYRRGFNTTTSSGTTYVYATDDADSVAYAEQRIGMCLTIP